MTSLSCGDAPSTKEISRATARGRPSLAWATSEETSCITAPFRFMTTWRGTGWSGLGHPHDQGVALAAAPAQGGRADPSAAPLQLQGEVEDQSRPGHPDRVPQGNGAAMDIHHFGGNP